MPVASLDDIKGKIGADLGPSPWIDVTQNSIETFADVTGDRQFIHVDPDMAARTSFGGTIAHGFLTLSLLSQMGAGVMLVPETTKMVVNYGFDRVRFLAPVRSGKRVRGHFKLVSFDEKRPGQWQALHSVIVEIEGEEKPALTAEWIGLIYV
jgi:acyl dehydratase